MLIRLISTLLIVLLSTFSVVAQEAPAPHNSPRIAVHRQSLAERHDGQLLSRQLSGPLVILDNERLRIGDVEFKLFGIVPPQLSANFGPQARSTLDSLANGRDVTCLIRDRDRDQRLMATCHTAINADPAYELLQRGLAVSSRAQLNGNELLTPYLAAEQYAQTQKYGVWSVALTAPQQASSGVEVSKIDTLIAAATPFRSETKDDKTGTPKTADDTAHKVVPFMSPPKPTFVMPERDMSMALLPSADFVSHFQILIAGILVLLTTMGILSAFAHYRRVEKREELKAIAAALRGELMAARAVCIARLKLITTAEEDKTTPWPRIRSTLYQAYVGRMGWLGAELARQIASIYGQANDYAAYYNDQDEVRTFASPKRQALDILIHHIEAVVPKLAVIEEKGYLPKRIAAALAYNPPPPQAVHARQPSRELMAIEHVSTSSAPVVATKEPSVVVAQTPKTEPQGVARVEPKSEPKDKMPAEEPMPAIAQKTKETPKPLWQAVRSLQQERQGIKNDNALEYHLPDYTAIIEEEHTEDDAKQTGADQALKALQKIRSMRS